METIGLGGSCHWCTEAIFQSLRGVSQVHQGWIASDGPASGFSEGVLVDFDPETIPLATLVAIHLYTHSCTAQHALREKYRSAIYTFTKEQHTTALEAIHRLQADYDQPIITEVLTFNHFRLNEPHFLNYYYNDVEKPFCRTYITPKLKQLMQDFSTYIK